jgi:hypothetical protein
MLPRPLMDFGHPIGPVAVADAIEKLEVPVERLT